MVPLDVNLEPSAVQTVERFFLKPIDHLFIYVSLPRPRTVTFAPLSSRPVSCVSNILTVACGRLSFCTVWIGLLIVATNLVLWVAVGDMGREVDFLFIRSPPLYWRSPSRFLGVNILGTTVCDVIHTATETENARLTRFTFIENVTCLLAIETNSVGFGKRFFWNGISLLESIVRRDFFVFDRIDITFLFFARVNRGRWFIVYACIHSVDRRAWNVHVWFICELSYANALSAFDDVF